MNVEILGIDPANKGAGLMFEAIRQQIDARFANASYAMSMSLPSGERRRLGVKAVFSRGPGRKNRLLRKLGQRLPRFTLRPFDIVPERDIDVIFDASGFAYGEFWGPEKMASRLSRHIAAWKRSGKKVIVLPQAWGPFENPRFAPLLGEIFTHANLVFARDQTSLSHLDSVVGKCQTLHLAPDFTNLLKPELPPRLSPYAGRMLIVPNAKIIESKGEGIRDRYIDFLAASVQAAKTADHAPLFLIHEGASDFAIAEQVNARLPEPIEIMGGLSPLHTKAVIGHAVALISSRFHGLVSGLSAGVPSLACGWSHKYNELLRDYGCPEWAVDLSRQDDIGGKLSSFFQAAQSDSSKARIKVASENQRIRSKAMWDKVFDVIGTA